jgi:thiol-disulfide isomerase/thioredoxin
MTQKKKKESWEEKRRRAALKHQKALEAERLRREREPRKRKGLSRSKVFGIGFLVLIVLVIGVFAALQNTQPSNTGELPPLYTLTDADFSEFTGRVVVIDCFATWCGPCIGEIPHLTEIVNNYDDSEVAVISVGSSSDSEIELRQFKKDHNMDWLVARDTVEVFNKYGIQAIPTIIILDQTGNIHYQHVGLAEASLLSSKINKLLSD